LKKNERASLRLFSLTVPCSEIFEWTINDAADTQNRYVSGNYNQQPAQPAFQDLSSKIWYALKLKNIKKQPVVISIKRNFVGEVVSATDNGEIIKEGLNLQSVNPNSTIKWNLTVPSGEKEIRYTYKIYVRK
jgi:hypothetical protein